ncbi:MAG: hypothetical protein ABEI77_06560 [Halorientalis sp.]
MTHGLQLLLVGVTGYALVSFSVGELVNVGIPLVLAFVPVVLRYRGYRLHPVVGLLIALAATLHVFGSLGLYQSVGWYDQLAHAVSASLVAGVGVALLQAVDRYRESIVIPSRLRFVFLFVFVTAIGVCWEIAEFSVELIATLTGSQALLTQYGLSDVVLDILFDALGAVVVAALGTQYFRHLGRLIGRQIGVREHEDA